MTASRRTAPRTPPALVAVAHGSRDPEALRNVTALLDRVRRLSPGLRVELGHIEIERPPLTETLARLRGSAVLVPLLLGRGHHIGYDLPHAVAGAPHPRSAPHCWWWVFRSGSTTRCTICRWFATR